MEESLSPLSAKESFDVYIAHRSAILTMWNYYSVGTLAVLAFAIGARDMISTNPARGLLLAGFLIFTLGNAWAVVASQHELRRMAEGLRTLLGDDGPGAKFKVKPIHPALFVVFYCAIAAAMTAVVVTRTCIG